MKLCPKCDQSKPLSAFRVRATGTPQSHCKTCDNLRAATWQKANRDKARAAADRYRLKNQPAINGRARAERAANPEAGRAAVARWRATNAEVARKASRAWYYANPAKARTQEAKRRAVKLQAVAAWANHDLIADIYVYARIMRVAGVDCHVDHIVPLQGKTVCGLHTHNNLTVLPAKVNIAKGNRMLETTV